MVFDKFPMLKIIMVYNTVNIIIAIIFYPIIPLLFNYPPKYVNTKFEIDIARLSYSCQYIIIILLIIVIGHFILAKVLKGIDRWEEANIDELIVIRRKCLNLPVGVYLCQIALAICIICFILIVLKVHPLLILKLCILFFSFLVSAALISLIFTKKMFRDILLKTSSSGTNREGVRIPIRPRIFLQILPLFLVAVLFTCLVGYSRLVKELGDRTFTSYKIELEDKVANIKLVNIDAIAKGLIKVKLLDSTDTRFIIDPKGKATALDNTSLSNFFIKYAREIGLKNNGHIYDYPGTDVQGVAITVKVNDGDYLVGIRYRLYSYSMVMGFIMSFGILFVLTVLVLSYFSKTLSEDISIVASSLTAIAEGDDIDYDKKLSVTSNDEIGDLVVAFNKILDLEKKNIKRIRENQEMLIQRDRLANLGELAGGVAHDINNPVAAIQTSLATIGRLLNRYSSLIDDQSATPEKLQGVVGQITRQIENSNNACDRIAKIVNSIRNHTRNLSGENIQEFDLLGVIEELKVLLNYQLKQTGCELVITEQGEKTLINGDPGKLGQVLTNLIVNAIQAYGDKPGKIEVNISRKEDCVILSVIDNALGFPEMLKESVFKKILTTRGADGTGFGLYLCNSIVTGHFGGEIWFESTEGKGTTFCVSIPLNKKQALIEELS